MKALPVFEIRLIVFTFGAAGWLVLVDAFSGFLHEFFVMAETQIVLS